MDGNYKPENSITFDQTTSRQEQQCDRQETTPAVITSQNYPSSYQRNSDCRYCVKSRAAGIFKKIELFRPDQIWRSLIVIVCWESTNVKIRKLRLPRNWLTQTGFKKKLLSWQGLSYYWKPWWFTDFKPNLYYNQKKSYSCHGSKCSLCKGHGLNLHNWIRPKNSISLFLKKFGPTRWLVISGSGQFS